MSDIKRWSTTAASNNAAAPDGAPEGTMRFSELNDWMRETHAAVRRWYDDAQFTDLGHSVSFVAAASFKVAASNVTSIYTTGRRLKAFIGAGQVTGDVVSSAFLAGDTAVTVLLDSGALDSSLTSVAVGIVTPTGNAIPKNLDLWAGSSLSTSALTVESLQFLVGEGVALALNRSGSDLMLGSLTASGGLVASLVVATDATISRLEVASLLIGGRQALDGDVSIVAGAAHSPSLASHGKTVIYTNAGGCAVTLPDISASAVPDGWWMGQLNQGAAAVIDTAVSGDALFTKATSLSALGLPTAGDGGRLICAAASKRFYWQGKRTFVSAEISITAGTATSLAHGLGVMPERGFGVMRNKVTDLGFSASDEVMVSGQYGDAGAAQAGQQVALSNTTLFLSTATFAPRILPKAGGAAAALDPASWRYVLKAEVWD